MGLFDKKRKELPAIFQPSELDDQPAEADYNQVIHYLSGLSDEDYETICKVAVIYREAWAKVAEALGLDNLPTTFIKPPELPKDSVQDPATADKLADSFLDDDDADLAAIIDEPEFLETDSAKKSKQIDVSDK